MLKTVSVTVICSCGRWSWTAARSLPSWTLTPILTLASLSDPYYCCRQRREGPPLMAGSKRRRQRERDEECPRRYRSQRQRRRTSQASPAAAAGGWGSSLPSESPGRRTSCRQEATRSAGRSPGRLTPCPCPQIPHCPRDSDPVEPPPDPLRRRKGSAGQGRSEGPPALPDPPGEAARNAIKGMRGRSGQLGGS